MRLLVVVLLLALASTTALAQNRVQPTWIQVGDWTLTPVVSPSRRTGVQVVGFLALGNKSVLTGSNITSIWYHRVSDDTWESKTWDSTDQWDAIRYVKNHYQIDDADDYFWPTSDRNTSELNTETPKDYLDGFKLEDPWIEEIISANDRDALVTALVAFGYQAADVPFERASESACGASIRLTGLAVGVEAEAASADPLAGAGMAAEQAYLAAMCIPSCIPTSWTEFIYGPWHSVGPWIARPVGTDCYYTQVMERTVVAIHMDLLATCIVIPYVSTYHQTGSQSITCPNPSGNSCLPFPNCLQPGTVLPIDRDPDLPSLNPQP